MAATCAEHIEALLQQSGLTFEIDEEWSVLACDSVDAVVDYVQALADDENVQNILTAAGWLPEYDINETKEPREAMRALAEACFLHDFEQHILQTTGQ